MQPKYIVYDDTAAGRLVPVSDEWDLRLAIKRRLPNPNAHACQGAAFIHELVERFLCNDYECLLDTVVAFSSLGTDMAQGGTDRARDQAFSARWPAQRARPPAGGLAHTSTARQGA
ncbi:hypothetical protein [Variovorax sp. dw_954]|uniref:hypothetical protein n=1 Tax=Variovorax sp. dw_954 TaxID=2720078 RepID=UPI001BD45B83|nr:hypothetical protein [Variovorax sp. dw_954]